MSYVAAGSMNGTVLIWDLSSASVETKLKGHQAAVIGCDWSADGSKLVSIAQDKNMILWQ